MFPKNGTRCQLWINCLELDNWSKYSMECFVHFKSEDFDRTSLSCIRLKPHAIPYICNITSYKLDKIQGKEPAKNTVVSKQESSSTSLHLALTQETNDDSDIFAEPVEYQVEKCSMDSLSFDEPLEKVLRVVPPSKSECAWELSELGRFSEATPPFSRRASWPQRRSSSLERLRPVPYDMITTYGYFQICSHCNKQNMLM